MPLDVRPEQPAPLHGPRFSFEEDRVFDVFEGGDKKLVLGLLWECGAWS